MPMIVASRELVAEPIGILGDCFGTPVQAFVGYTFAMAEAQLVWDIEFSTLEVSYANILP